KPITPLYKLAQKGLKLLGKILPKDLRDFLVEKKKFIGQPPERDLDTDSLDKVGARQSVQLKATFTAIARREQALEQLITARNGTLAKAREIAGFTTARMGQVSAGTLARALYLLESEAPGEAGSLRSK